MISLRDVVTGFGNRDPLAEVWRRSLRGGGGGAAEITGVPPLRYIGDGRPLTNYLISGNAVQDGAPSAEVPVDAAGSGVRTGNLVRFYQEEVQGNFYGVDITLKNAEITLNGTVTAGSGHWVEIGFKFGGGTVSTDNVVIPCEPETPYTIATEILGGNSSEVRLIAFGTSDGNKLINIGSSLTTIFDNDINRIFISLGAEGVVFNNLKIRVMFNKGAASLPYEPYGYKLPLTVNSTEYPIYLGTVPTTRRIKKLVLTGDETWYSSSRYIGSLFAYYSQFPGIASRSSIYCSHLIAVDSISQYQRGTCICDASSVSLWIFDTITSPARFKSYLAAQYAAGTPVTVWYVLAEPDTAVVNEPLMKIGDYADTISAAQAGVTIPTIDGENILDVPTEVPPSEITIKGGISSV